MAQSPGETYIMCEDCMARLWSADLPFGSGSYKYVPCPYVGEDGCVDDEDRKKSSRSTTT